MKQLSLTLLALSLSLNVATAQDYVVTQQQMQAVYDASLTPYKYGLVVAPADNYHKIDCPTVFREGDNWYMTYVVYNGKGGKDGRGYETWISQSQDLLHWQTLGRVLSYIDNDSTRWDRNQRGGFPALLDWTWGGSYRLQDTNGRHWMSYLGGEGRGYEGVQAPLHVGMAYTDGDVSQAHEWASLDHPVLSEADADVQWWDGLIQYKSMVYLDEEQHLGAPYLMYYNAGGINPETGYKGERIGIATSHDMLHWKRYEGNPVFSHEAQGIITGDAQIQRMDDLFVMYYFSAFNPTRTYSAYNTFACSRDLIHWYDWEGPDLIIPSEPYDQLFAHKSFVLKHDGVVYHFYCAVNDPQQRGIAVATSVDFGHSDVCFPAPPPVKKKK